MYVNSGVFSWWYWDDFVKNDAQLMETAMIRCICMLIEISSGLISSLRIWCTEDDIRECSTSAWVRFDEDMEASEIIEEESLSPGTEEA